MEPQKQIKYKYLVPFYPNVYFTNSGKIENFMIMPKDADKGNLMISIKTVHSQYNFYMKSVYM